MKQFVICVLVCFIFYVVTVNSLTDETKEGIDAGVNFLNIIHASMKEVEDSSSIVHARALQRLVMASMVEMSEALRQRNEVDGQLGNEENMEETAEQLRYMISNLKSNPELLQMGEKLFKNQSRMSLTPEEFWAFKNDPLFKQSIDGDLESSSFVEVDATVDAELYTHQKFFGGMANVAPVMEMMLPLITKNVKKLIRFPSCALELFITKFVAVVSSQKCRLNGQNIDLNVLDRIGLGGGFTVPAQSVGVAIGMDTPKHLCYYMMCLQALFDGIKSLISGNNKCIKGELSKLVGRKGEGSRNKLASAQMTCGMYFASRLNQENQGCEGGRKKDKGILLRSCRARDCSRECCQRGGNRGRHDDRESDDGGDDLDRGDDDDDRGDYNDDRGDDDDDDRGDYNDDRGGDDDDDDDNYQQRRSNGRRNNYQQRRSYGRRNQRRQRHWGQQQWGGSGYYEDDSESLLEDEENVSTESDDHIITTAYEYGFQEEKPEPNMPESAEFGYSSFVDVDSARLTKNDFKDIPKDEQGFFFETFRRITHHVKKHHEWHDLNAEGAFDDVEYPEIMVDLDSKAHSYLSVDEAQKVANGEELKVQGSDFNRFLGHLVKLGKIVVKMIGRFLKGLEVGMKKCERKHNLVFNFALDTFGFAQIKIRDFHTVCAMAVALPKMMPNAKEFVTTLHAIFDAVVDKLISSSLKMALGPLGSFLLEIESKVVLEHGENYDANIDSLLEEASKRKFAPEDEPIDPNETEEERIKRENERLKDVALIQVAASIHAKLLATITGGTEAQFFGKIFGVLSKLKGLVTKGMRGIANLAKKLATPLFMAVGKILEVVVGAIAGVLDKVISAFPNKSTKDCVILGHKMRQDWFEKITAGLIGDLNIPLPFKLPDIKFGVHNAYELCSSVSSLFNLIEKGLKKVIGKVNKSFLETSARIQVGIEEHIHRKWMEGLKKEKQLEDEAKLLEKDDMDFEPASTASTKLSDRLIQAKAQNYRFMQTKQKVRQRAFIKNRLQEQMKAKGVKNVVKKFGNAFKKATSFLGKAALKVGNFLGKIPLLGGALSMPFKVVGGLMTGNLGVAFAGPAMKIVMHFIRALLRDPMNAFARVVSMANKARQSCMSMFKKHGAEDPAQDAVQLDLSVKITPTAPIIKIDGSDAFSVCHQGETMRMALNMISKYFSSKGNKLMGMLNKLKGGFKSFGKGLANIAKSLFKIFLKFLKKLLGGLGKLAWKGIKAVGKFVGKAAKKVWGGVKKGFKAIGKGVKKFFCFASGTQIQLSNGTTKAIETIKIGDKILGGKVTATMQFLANGVKLYNYKNIVVAGHHKVLENGKFIAVHHSKLANEIMDPNVNILYDISTDSHRIQISNTVFADFTEVPHNNLVEEIELSELNNENIHLKKN